MDTEYIVIISVLSVVLLLVIIFGSLYVINKHQIAESRIRWKDNIEPNYTVYNPYKD